MLADMFGVGPKEDLASLPSPPLDLMAFVDSWGDISHTAFFRVHGPALLENRYSSRNEWQDSLRVSRYTRGFLEAKLYGGAIRMVELGRQRPALVARVVSDSSDVCFMIDATAIFRQLYEDSDVNSAKESQQQFREVWDSRMCAQANVSVVNSHFDTLVFFVKHCREEAEKRVRHAFGALSEPPPPNCAAATAAMCLLASVWKPFFVQLAKDMEQRESSRSSCHVFVADMLDEFCARC
jgi:hypothetical protein